MRSKRLQREIDDLVAQGWKIEDEDRDRVVMVDREYGSVASHVLVAIITVWWTLGLGNVLWGLYNYAVNSRRRVLWEDAVEHRSTGPASHARQAVGCPNCGADVSPDAAYCPTCGTDLDRTVPGEGTLTCPECEAVVTEGSRYCRSCGTKLADAMAEG